MSMKARITHFMANMVPHLWGVGIPIIAGAIAYAGVSACGFVGFDDDLYVFDNLIVSRGLTFDGLKWALTAFHASTWQPLVWLSFMLDVECSGISASAMHITNMGLHLLNVALVYCCWALMTHHPRRALIVALLFAIHPIHVESIAWISERKDVLSAAFWWLSILAYARYTQRRTWKRYVWVFLFLTLGLLAKPMLITLPAALLILDVWPLKRVTFESRSNWTTVLLEKTPLLLPVVLSSLITYHVQSVGGSVLGVATISLWGRFGNACVSYVRYIGKLIYPVRLSILYPHPGAWPPLTVIASLAVIVALLVWAWRRKRQAPHLLMGALWFLVILLPTMGLIQIGWHAMADRFLYIPAVGLYVALTWTLAPWVERRSPKARAGALVVLAILATTLIARTRDQVSLWRNSVTLFSHATRVTQNNWMMHNCCGAALARTGRDAEAAPHFEETIRLRPERPRAYYNLGCVRFREEHWEEAARLFSQSAEILPTHKSLYNLAAAQTRLGTLTDAEMTYLKLLERSPRHTPTLNNLGCLYRGVGRLDDALVMFQGAIAIDPAYLNAHYNFAVTLMEKGDTVGAIKRFVYILNRDPKHAGARKGIQKAMAPSSTSTPAKLDASQ